MIIYTEKFCTPFDLKVFAFQSDASLNDLQRFLESKTRGRYTVIDKAFLKELYQLIDYNTGFSSKVSQQLSNGWTELIKHNDEVKVKWAEHIRMFGL